MAEPVGHLWLFQDVTRERQTADQLIYLAERDALTGLYNRHRFNEELARMIADAQRHAARVALLFFDLDDFKYINDTFGHRAGDAMLIRVAGEMGGQVRRNEIFARLGGDEFAILVPEISDEMLRVLAERITRSIAQIRFQFEGQSLRLTSSLGIAVYPDHADNAEDLIARADTAMYQAKEAGKNAWRIYRSDLDTSLQMVKRMSWNDRILHALENNLMDLQFQGVYSTTDRVAVALRGAGAHARQGRSHAAAHAGAVHSGSGEVGQDPRHRPLGAARIHPDAGGDASRYRRWRSTFPGARSTSRCCRSTSPSS